ncbi:MAG TPA: hypothetical protein VGK04_01385 [Thermoanaerobaculia bacterium]
MASRFRYHHIIRLIITTVLALLPISVFAQTGGGGSASGLTSASSTSGVSLTIPGVVAIDVETDVQFDLSAKLGGPSIGRAGGACAEDKFPPAPACTGAVVYTATGSTTTSTAPAPAPGTGDVWLSLYTNKSGAGSTIGLQASASAWSSAPVATNTHLQLLVAKGATNGGIGNTTPAEVVPGAGGPVTLSGTAAGPFGWTRHDQNIKLQVKDGSGNASGVTFNAVTATTTITFTANAS